MTTSSDPRKRHKRRERWRHLSRHEGPHCAGKIVIDVLETHQSMNVALEMAFGRCLPVEPSKT